MRECDVVYNQHVKTAAFPVSRKHNNGGRSYFVTNGNGRHPDR